jgi:two-component system nitrate/nitrite response regulator NarL
MTHSAKPIRIMLVDTQPIVIWAIERLIDAEKPRMEVVAKASNGTEAALLASQMRPDIVLLDLRVDDGEGADLVASIASDQRIRIVIYTEERDQATIDRAILNGARGLVRREETTDTLLRAISRVHAGQLWLNREITSRIFAEFTRPAGPVPVDPAAALIGSLTPKELAIASAFSNNPGCQNKQLSELLFISEHTTRNHLTSIFSKLNVKDRCGLCNFVRLNTHQL